MTDRNDNKNAAVKKSFFAKMLEKLDKKMEEKAKSSPCCCGPSDKDKGDSSCCK